MKRRELIKELMDAFPDNSTMYDEVKVLDEDGFIHEVGRVIYDPDDQCFYIRTNWSYE